MEMLDHFIRGPSIHFVPKISEITALYILKPKSQEWLFILSLGKRAKLTPYLRKTLTGPSDEPSKDIGSRKLKRVGQIWQWLDGGSALQKRLQRVITY